MLAHWCRRLRERRTYDPYSGWGEVELFPVLELLRNEISLRIRSKLLKEQLALT